MKKVEDNFQDGWQNVIPLIDSESSLPELPIDSLPGILAETVEGISLSTETPPELAFVFSMGAIAASIQGKFVVEIWDGYSEPLGFWGSSYSASGERKTANYMACTAPIRAWERLQKQKYKPLIVEAFAKRKNQESKINALRKKLGSTSDTMIELETEAQIIQLEKDLEEIPVEPRILTEDITPERLGTLLAEQKERIAVISDEAGIFEILAGRYNQNTPNLDLFLKGYSGSSHHTDRQGRAGVYLKAPILSVVVSPQPSVLEDLGKRKEFRGRGLLARFHHLIPKSKVGFRPNEFGKFADETKAIYAAMLNRFLDFSPEEAISIPLTSEAQRLHKNLLGDIEIQMRNGHELSSLKDWANKLCGSIARISGLFTLIETWNQIEKPLVVEAETYSRAAALVPYFKAHALKAFNLMKQNRDEEGAYKIIDWIQQNNLKSFSARACFIAHKHFFERMSKLWESLDLLREHQYLKAFIFEPEVGRPSQRLVVNPIWFEGGIDCE